MSLFGKSDAPSSAIHKIKNSSYSPPEIRSLLDSLQEDESFDLRDVPWMLSHKDAVVRRLCASLEGTLEVAQSIFTMPVRSGAPGEGLTGLVDSVRRPKFATAAGLMLFGMKRIHEDLGIGRGPGIRALSRLGVWLKDFF